MLRGWERSGPPPHCPSTLTDSLVMEAGSFSYSRLLSSPWDRSR